MTRLTLPLLLLAGVAATPAAAQTSDAPFTGPRVEVLAGTDGGLLYGGGVGYDFQTGKVVLGLEGEFTLSTDRDCETLNTVINDRLCSKLDHDIYGGARIGVVLGTGTLLYGKAGYSNLRNRVTYDAGSGTGDFVIKDRFDGIRVGAGLEQKIGRNAFVKGEYRYSDYEAGAWKHEGVVGVGIRF